MADVPQWVVDRLRELAQYPASNTAAFDEYLSLHEYYDIDFPSSVMERITAWIASAIDDVKKWWLLQQHYFAIWLTDVIATGSSAFIVIAVFIATAALLLYAAPLAAASASWLVVKEWFEGLKNFTGSLLDFLHYRELLVVHEIVMAISPAYRDTVNIVYKSLAGLSEQLGYDMGFVISAIRNAKAIAFSTYNLLGISLERKELAWADESTVFFEKIQNRFERYVLEPGLLLRDIDMELVEPMSRDATDQVQRIFGTISTINDWVQEKTKVLTTLRTDIDTFVGDLPMEIADAIAPHITSTLAVFDNFFDNTWTPIMDSINQSIGVIDSALVRNEEKLVALEVKQETIASDTLGKLFDGYILYGDDLRAMIYRSDKIQEVSEYKPTELPLLMLEEKPHKPIQPVFTQVRSNPFVGDY